MDDEKTTSALDPNKRDPNRRLRKRVRIRTPADIATIIDRWLTKLHNDEENVRLSNVARAMKGLLDLRARLIHDFVFEEQLKEMQGTIVTLQDTIERLMQQQDRANRVDAQPTRH